MGRAERCALEQVGRKVVHSRKVPAFFLDTSPPSYVASEESHLPGLNWAIQKHWLSKLKCQLLLLLSCSVVSDSL